MKTVNFDKLEKMNFYGTDVNLEISLMEYGLICREWENSYQFIYVTEWKGYEEPELFDVSILSDSEINEVFDDLNDDNGMLNFVGMEETEWKELPTIHKVSDLISYWGYENIFGSAYYPLTVKELNEWM